MKVNLTTQILIHLPTTMWFWHMAFAPALETTYSYEELASRVHPHQNDQGSLPITKATLKSITPEGISSQGYVDRDSINLKSSQYKSGAESIPRGYSTSYQDEINRLGWCHNQSEHLLHFSASPHGYRQDHMLSNYAHPDNQSSCRLKAYNTEMTHLTMYPDSKLYGVPCTQEFNEALTETKWDTPRSYLFLDDHSLLQNDAHWNEYTVQEGESLEFYPELQRHEHFKKATSDTGHTLDNLELLGYSGNMGWIPSELSENGIGLCRKPSTEVPESVNVINMNAFSYPSG